MNSSTKKKCYLPKELFSYYSDIEHEKHIMLHLKNTSLSRHDESHESKKRVFRVMMNRMNRKRESCESSWIVWIENKSLASHHVLHDSNNESWQVMMTRLDSSFSEVYQELFFLITKISFRKHCLWGHLIFLLMIVLAVSPLAPWSHRIWSHAPLPWCVHGRSNSCRNYSRYLPARC